MIEPKLEHYPKWLQVKIEKRFAFEIGGVSTNEEAYGNIKAIYEHYRTDPISSVVFELFLDSVRKRFNFYYLQKRVNEQNDEIATLRKEIASLKKKVESLDQDRNRKNWRA